MHILRKAALGILSLLFIFLLFATAFDIGFINTATHPGTVKRLVRESGLYDSLVPSVLQQTKTIDTSAGSISTSDPTIQAATKTALSPQYVQRNAEAAIDNLYTWLDGKIEQPTFNFNLAGQKATIADSLATSVQQRAASLPACSYAQSLAISRSGTFDAINATCLPRGVTPAIAAANTKTALLNSGFLKDLDVNASSIGEKIDPECQGLDPIVACPYNTNFFKDHSYIPKQYQKAKKTPFILATLTILTATGIVFLSSTWQKGLRHIGINLVIIGLVMLLFSWALNRAVSTKVVPKISVDNAILQKDIRNLVTDVAGQIDKNYWFFGGLYTLAGVSAITAGYFAMRRGGTPAPAGNTGSASSPRSKK
jgi:hypothetical protein